ncbi:MAG: transglutaminase TgpA family protein [Methylomonas sp.]
MPEPMPPPIDSSLSRHSLIFLLTAIGLITLPHTQNIPVPLIGFFALLLVWRFVGIWYCAWLPNRFLLFLLMILGMALLYSQHQGLFGRDAGTSLFVVALGLKLLEIHGKREIYLVVFMAFIVAASQFLYEQSILMAGYSLAVCTVLLATLVIQNSRQPGALLALKTALIIIVQAVPIAIVMFVVFPRIEAPHWMWLDDKSQAKSGLGNTLEPGSITDLSLSGELVFRVRFNGEMPPPRLRYWRGPVYSFTDGVKWSAPINRYFNTEQEEPDFSGQPYSYTLLMEPQNERWVFALELPSQFDSSLHRNNLYQLLSSKKPGERAEYQITSYPTYNTGKLSQAEQKENLRLPAKPSEEITELVKQLKGFDAEPEAFIRNLLGHFRQENFHYTLTPPLMPDKPIETFLFKERSGFCSHYATAFVYLMRVAQIPARVIGGYQGGELNKVGNFLEIRQADAHAWAEVWLDGKGWVRFDPTAAIAPERIERGVNVDLQIASGAVNFSPVTLDAKTLSWLKRSRQLWQSIDYNWQRWVINYDTKNQSQFLAGLGIDDWAALARWLVGSVTVITLLLAAWILRRKRVVTDKALLQYRRFLNKMAKIGLEIRQGEGPKDFAERAKALRPVLSRQVSEITALYIRLRYEANASANDFRQLKKHVTNLKI